MPTLAERGGDFTYLFNPAAPPSGGSKPATNPCDGTTVYQGQILDPATQRVVGGTPCQTAFPGNMIPTERFSAVAKNFLAYLPAPSIPGLFNNHFFQSTIPLVNTTYTVRVDASLSAKHKIFASYSTRDNNRTFGGNLVLPYPEDPNT